MSQQNKESELKKQIGELQRSNKELKSKLTGTELKLAGTELRLAESQRNIAPWNEKYTLARYCILAVFFLSSCMIVAVSCETWGTGLSMKHFIFLAIALLALLGTVWGAFWYTRTLR